MPSTKQRPQGLSDKTHSTLNAELTSVVEQLHAVGKSCLVVPKYCALCVAIIAFAALQMHYRKVLQCPGFEK